MPSNSELLCMRLSFYGTYKSLSVSGRSRLLRYVWIVIGILMIGIGAVGILLPGVPTTVFVLVAVWAFTKGNPKWAARLETHPVFGPLIEDWRQHRAIPASAKIMAVSMMATSLLALFLWSPLPFYGIVFIGVAMGLVAAWILCCPTARPSDRSAASDHRS